MLSALNLLNRKDPAPARQWLPSWRAILGLELILLATAARAGEPVSPARASTAPRIDYVPATTLAVGSLRVDFAALYRFFLQTVPEPEQPRLANAEIALKGVFLGLDPRTRILPGLGPRILAFADAPADWEAGRKPGPAPVRNWPFPSVIALELQADPDRNPSSSLEARQPTVADALDNALNTLLALVTFNGKFAEARSRIITHEISGVTVKTGMVQKRPFSGNTRDLSADPDRSRVGAGFRESLAAVLGLQFRENRVYFRSSSQ